MCWLIRWKARVRAPGQTSKQNTKSISSTISSQQISGKNSESKIKLPWKVSQKICHSESTLNSRSLHLCIKLTLISLRGGTSSAFYTHRTRISTMFFKNAFSCLSALKEVAYFIFELYTQRNITVGFTNILWESLLTMRNILDFLKNICQIK